MSESPTADSTGAGRRYDDATQEVLISEYETTQSHVNTVWLQYWSSVSLMMGTTIPSLFIAYTQTSGTEGAVLLTVASVVLLFLLQLWRRYWDRLLDMRAYFYRRMRQIERVTGMRKNIYTDLLTRWKTHELEDDWNHLLTEQEKQELERQAGNLKSFYDGPKPQTVINTSLYAIRFGWVFATVAKWAQVAL